jgi:NAD-reducing hydrogenase large subunit
MKFPYLVAQGKEEGTYRVGPLARINNCDFIDTPLAEQARVRFRAFADEGLVQSTLAYHWARMIELLHCAEAIKDLLNDPDILGKELVTEGQMRNKGIGVIEAPRGSLFHHYEIDEGGLVTRANLIVSTTNNNRAMNESIRRVAIDELNGRELTEPLLNQIEVAIRAYDPCLSCATHALGKMPLEVQLVDAEGHTVDRLYKNANGDVSLCKIEA